MESTFTCKQTKNCSTNPYKERSGFLLSLKTLPTILLIFLSFFSTQIFGQAGNIDQVRNGPANDPSKNFHSTFNNPEWVNGNAGSSNAHYVEGMSIAYRSLLTGVINGSSYEYLKFINLG